MQTVGEGPVRGVWSRAFAPAKTLLPGRAAEPLVGASSRLTERLAPSDLVEGLRVPLRRRRARVLVVLALVSGAGGVAWFAGGSARTALATAATGDPRLELAAVTGFAVSLLATALGWRVVFRGLGARIDAVEACGMYAAGSLVNAVCPARLGDGLRAGLFARHLPRREGTVFAAAGALGAVGLARGLAQLGVIGAGAAVGAVPVWPLLVLGGIVTAGVGAAVVVDRHRVGRRLGRLVQATATVVSRPRLGLKLLTCSLLAVGGQLLAAAGTVSALGVHDALLASLAMTAALDVAAAMPITPGGLGLTSGAVTLALTSRGVSVSTALAAGLVFQAASTASSLGFAAICVPLAARPRLAKHPGVRIAAAVVAAATLAAISSAALGSFG